MMKVDIVIFFKEQIIVFLPEGYEIIFLLSQLTCTTQDSV